jgi:hypothetical protein
MSAALLVAAVTYAEAGVPVFPVAPGEKRPHGRLAPHGFKDATTDIDRVSSWWLEEPSANIGLPTGARFAVLDVDPRNGGEESLAKLFALGCRLSETWAARTQSGGAHYYFLPDERVSKTQKLAAGLDLKDAGGYVLAPPSIGPQGAYRWLHGGPGSGVALAPQPDWLVRGRIALERPAPAHRPDLRRRGTGRVTPQGFPKGSRNHGLFTLATAWRGRGVSYADALDAIRASAEMCDPPVAARHAVALLDRIYERYIEGGAR